MPGAGCGPDRQCVLIVRKGVKERWRKAIAGHEGWLASTRRCESGAHGGYALSSTGNGFWFAYQFTPTTWAKVAGGRRSPAGRPVGAWSTHPTNLEQDYRAVRVLRAQGRAAWPNCG